MIITKPYNRVRAVEYARRWALSRNPLFFDFTGGGGNCTNFVSQSLLAGALVMDSTETFGWYYESVGARSPSWTGVREFYEFIRPERCLWATPDWLWDNDDGGGFNTGPYETVITRSWMEELGVKEHLITKDGTAVFEI